MVDHDTFVQIVGYSDTKLRRAHMNPFHHHRKAEQFSSSQQDKGTPERPWKQVIFPTMMAHLEGTQQYYTTVTLMMDSPIDSYISSSRSMQQP